MSFSKAVKNTLIYIIIRCLIFLACHLPRRLIITLFSNLGIFCYYCIASERQKIRKNLRFAFEADKSPKEIDLMTKKVFIAMGKNLADIFRLRIITSISQLEQYVIVQGMEHLQTAYEKGRGVICITGHIGAFELLAAYLSLKGFNLSVIGTELYDKRLNRLLVENRRHSGIHNISRGKQTRKILRALHDGHILGILMDQDTKVESRFVPFFGKEAFTPVGPALLALKTRAPVIPLFIQRMENDTHCITVLNETTIARSGNLEEDLIHNTAQFTKIIEDYVRSDPSQWVWMHDRWKTKKVA